MPTPNKLLDLEPSIGQRSESVQWNLYGSNNNQIGEVHPSDDHSAVPSMSVNANAAIPRTISNLVFDRRELGAINPFTDRIRPMWVLEDGSYWPLGELMFTDDPETLSTGPSVSSTTLFDGLFQLDVATDRTFDVKPSASIETAIRTVLDVNGIWRTRVTPTGVLSGATAQAWPIGSNWREILKQLCGLAGFLPPYCDNTGVLVCRPAQQISPGDGHLVYDEHTSRIVAGSGVTNANLLTAPNAHIVIGTGSTSGEVSAIAYVSPSARNSRENIGRVRPLVHQEPGVADTAAAQAMADAYASAGLDSYETARFVSAPDPRHDVFDLVDFLGTTYIETAWNLPLEPGGEMSHTVSKNAGTS